MNAVAETILEQLGGNMFVAMSGAKYLVKTEDSLRFKFRGSKKYNYLEVTLTPADVYDLRFCKLGKWGEVETEETVEGIYFDQLQAVFAAETGLYTHL